MEMNPGGSVNGDDDGGRASKKKAIPSSVHKVLSNDDLLIEILLLLPLISLHLLKRVSKHWLSLITSPSFILRRTQISAFVPPSGLFIVPDVSFSAYYFMSFDSRKLFKRSTFNYNSEDTSAKSLIVQSCNGLLLCYVVRDYTKHLVCNPLTRAFKILPPIHPLKYLHSSCFSFFRMAFDPDKSHRYNVVHVGPVHDVAFDSFGCSFKVQTYSSETGVWTVWDDRFPSTSFYGFGSGIYCNGAIHWFTDGRSPFHFKLEFVDRLVLTNIQSPVTLEGKVHHHRKLFGSYGSLLLLCKDHHLSRKLNIYEMKNGYSEWSIKYFVNLDNMLRRTWKLKDWDCYNIWSIFFGERDEDSFMVIELSGKLLQYKFVSKTVSKLLDLEEGIRRRRRHGHCDCHDFIASFAHV